MADNSGTVVTRCERREEVRQDLRKAGRKRKGTGTQADRTRERLEGKVAPKQENRPRTRQYGIPIIML